MWEIEAEEARQEGSPVQVLCLGEGLLFCSSLSEREKLRYSVIIHPLKHLGAGLSFLGPVVLL